MDDESTFTWTNDFPEGVQVAAIAVVKLLGENGITYSIKTTQDVTTVEALGMTEFLRIVLRGAVAEGVANLGDALGIINEDQD